MGRTNTRNTALVACLAFGISACGMANHSTPVVKVDEDTYRVATDDPIPAIAMQAALGQAQVHCGSLHREILVKDQAARKAEDRNFHEVNFRCLAKGDPELKPK